MKLPLPDITMNRSRSSSWSKSCLHFICVLSTTDDVRDQCCHRPKSLWHNFADENLLNILLSAPAVYEKKYNYKLFYKVNLCVNGKFSPPIYISRANTTRNEENTKGRTLVL